MDCNKSGPKKEDYGSTGLPKEARKISNNLTSKGARRRTKNIIPRKRREIIKIRAEISDIRIKQNKTKQTRSVKPRPCFLKRSTKFINF